ncbi:MAG: phosphatidylglycerophosphatase A [Micavibrio sp.]|nr:MAG: phosphatidylglycerophosphatase A [Micavibrio sp.]
MNKKDIRQPYILLATWFGFGFVPKAPGTWGSAMAIPPGLLLLMLGGVPVLLIGIVIITALGFWAAKKFDEAYGTHDSKMIVIDEVAGQWIALIPVLTASGLNPILTLLAFGLFRLFDITKPWPASHFDKKIEGPLGVMGDDIVAGIMALLCLEGIIYVGLV